MCGEPDRVYDPKKFNGRVERYELFDHQAPPLELILPFCVSAKEWLDADPENVVVVHCKAGKGRAGTMLCCLMVHLEMENLATASEVMEFYGSQRTYNGKGVTIPSQRRYVHYWERVRQGGDLVRPPLSLSLVRLHNFTSEIWLEIDLNHGETHISSKEFQNVKVGVDPVTRSAFVQFLTPLQIQGDVLFLFYTKRGSSAAVLCRCWLNTHLIDTEVVSLDFSQLDGAKKGKLPTNAVAELTFLPLEVPRLPNLGAGVEVSPAGDPQAAPAAAPQLSAAAAPSLVVESAQPSLLSTSPSPLPRSPLQTPGLSVQGAVSPGSRTPTSPRGPDLTQGTLLAALSARREMRPIAIQDPALDDDDDDTESEDSSGDDPDKPDTPSERRPATQRTSVAFFTSNDSPSARQHSLAS
eukprot:TRINITY_DN2647_c0_g1_i3.p1 TRINITY_DN2647_c0_g1~~TRINITY_DN2647_c0_g1_i3.p1  ORF type:complete len:478 (-),score=94.12 TRINITY_DN2647_c0_g1_i3:118-1347(-)